MAVVIIMEAQEEELDEVKPISRVPGFKAIFIVVKTVLLQHHAMHWGPKILLSQKLTLALFR